MDEGTLLLRCAGVLQSWGAISRFAAVRDTEREPTKSGIVGLVCSALGRSRSDDIADLTLLRMGTRVDFPGEIRIDLQTAQKVITSKGKKTGNEVSRRYYLCDADFLVGLYGNLATLIEVETALRKPVWPLYLGRKGYAPIVPVWIPNGLKPGVELKEALLEYPWPRLLFQEPERKAGSLKLITEADVGTARSDVPLSFESASRRFTTRKVQVEFVAIEKVPRWS